jgi:outer membrane protein TolC
MRVDHNGFRVSGLAAAFAAGSVCLALLAVGPLAAEEPPPFEPAVPLPKVISTRTAPAETLDVAGCVTLALEYNEQVLAERERREELNGQMYQALSTGLPSLDLAGEWRRGRDPSFALDETFGGGGGIGIPADAPDWFQEWLAGFGSFIPAPDAIPAQTFLRANATLNWEINPVKISGAVGAANTGIDRQERIVTAVENETAENVVVAYHQIIQAAESVLAVEAQRTNQKELLDLVRLRYELGLADRLDTLQAAVGLANLEPQLRVAQQALRNSGAQLNALIGRNPDLPLAVRNEQEIERAPIDREAAMRIAMERPELKADELLVEILRRNRTAQASEMYPYLTLFGQYGYVGKKPDSVFENGHDYWSAAVALNIPVFDGLLTRGRVREAEAQIRRTETELAGRRRTVRVSVLELVTSVEAARQVLDAAELNLASSQEALSESMLRLELGQARYLDVLLAESNRAQARSNVIDARFEVLRRTASLKRALGYSPLTPLTEIPGLVAEVP